MLSLQDIAQQIDTTIKSDIIKFQRLVLSKQILQHPDLLRVLSDILASTIHNHQQKQLAATSLKSIFQKRLNQNYELNVYRCWDEYFMHFVQRDGKDIIQWKYLTLTISSVKYLIPEMSEQLLHKSMQKYQSSSSLLGKMVLQYGFLDNQQISQSNRLTFFRETIQDFINQSFQLLKQLHQQQQATYNSVLFEHDIMMALFQWIAFLKHQPQDNYQEKLSILAKNQNLIQLIKEQLKIYISIQTNQQLMYHMDTEVIKLLDQTSFSKKLNTTTQVIRILKLQANTKSFSINILECLASAFQSTVGIQQFDTIPTLNLLQLVTPILIHELQNNRTLKQLYIKDQSSQMSQPIKSLITSIFDLLKRSSNFIFLMQILQQLKDPILYAIFPFYLNTSQSELSTYKQDGKQFLQLSEGFIERLTQETCNNPKEACGCFMQLYFKLINNAQAEFIQFLSHALKYKVHNQESPITRQLESKGYKIPSIQTIYLMLTRLFFFADKSNQYFTNYIYDNFITPDFVFNFNNLEKSRFLIFITYGYGQYFSQNINEGSKYIGFGFETRGKNESQFEIFLSLLENSFQFGIAESVWGYLLGQLQSTQNTKVLKLMRRLLQSHISSIGTSRVLQLSHIISTRIHKQFDQNKQNFQQPGGSYDFLYNCFNIIQLISENKQLLTQQSLIIEQILSIVDFFTSVGIQNYQFNCELVKFLNNIVEIQQVITVEFQKYLQSLGSIVVANQFYGPVMDTYYLIILKGAETFEQKPEFLQAIQQSIENILLSQYGRSQQLLVQSIFLLQNIYLVYPHLIKENRNLYNVTLEIYHSEKENLNPNPKIVASILLFWMSGEFVFGDYNLGILNQCKIEIFKEQFGLMFALNLRKLIEKYHQTESLPNLLKLSLKLLDYQHHYKNEKKYKGPQFTLPIFKKYIFLDSFEQINTALQFLRQNLSREDFSSHMNMLKNQIGGDELTQLLRVRMFDNRKERNIVTVKRI